MRTLRGRSATKALAASCAAMSRFGCTSAARMLPDTSIASTMVCSCSGRLTIAAGRATASSSEAMATSSSAGGTWRRQAPCRPSASFTRPRLA